MSETDPTPYGISIAGDSTVDWCVAEPPGRMATDIETRYVWQMVEGPGVGSIPGGAALDALLLQATSQLAGGTVPVAGPVLPHDILDDPTSTEITRTFSFWKLTPRTNGSKDSVWRLDRFIGLHPAKSYPASVAVPPADFVPACLVLEDGNQLFQRDPAYWPKELAFPGSEVLIRQTGALGTGLLWEYLSEHAPDRTTMFCMVGDLRKDGAQIGQPLSWERTAQDVVRAVRARTELARVRRIVVGLAGSGAVIVDRDGADLLIYDPRAQEGDWERIRPGQQYGTGTMVLLALAWAVGQSGPNADIQSAVISGIETARVLHDQGFAAEPTESGLRIDFPRDRLTESLAGGVDADSDIQCVEISTNPSWRVFDAVGSFREAAAQIARFGVNRVGREIPLETMGYWSSVDRIEIESMRSVRNIIFEYLSSSRRSRPLSIAVFGPPGSGKSFAIKQMASVIGPQHNPLGSLEFNLSQFHDVDELPGAFQQIRDLRLREYLPLVFWDEFDTALNGQELGWLVNFLAPMQDGAFTETGIDRPIGPAIFIFAGGTHATMQSFKNRALELPGAKATDFLSRLRGFVDVLGPNPDSPDDRTYHLRRAILLRSILQRNAPQIFERDEMRIDDSLLAAFLDVPKYLHGSRSMEAVIEMSAISRKMAYERSTLPAAHQLALHVDAAAFLRVVQGGASSGGDE